MKVIIVGAGIIGLSVAHNVLKSGASVCIVDRDPEGDKASFGNAGGIAVTEMIPASVPGLWKKLPFWILDPLGPLTLRASHAPKLVPWLWRFARAGTGSEVNRISHALAALNGRVYEDLLPLLNEVGLSSDLHRKGALTVYENADGMTKDRAEWNRKRDLGVEVVELDANQTREMEPALGPIVKSGVFTPQWSHISDPKKIVDMLRSWLLANGAEIVRGNVLGLGRSPSGLTAHLEGGRDLQADHLVVAAGAWSGCFATLLGDRVLLESERGYNTTIEHSGVDLQREVIFADRKFVATPLSIGLRIGGAAEFGGLSAEPNFARSKALLELAKLYFPGLHGGPGVEWSGHRPATPDSLPVIGRASSDHRVVYAFGHGHLGLTQGPTTGKLVADLIFQRKPPIDLSPYSIARFNSFKKESFYDSPDVFLR